MTIIDTVTTAGVRHYADTYGPAAPWVKDEPNRPRYRYAQNVETMCGQTIRAAYIDRTDIDARTLTTVCESCHTAR